MDRLHLRFDFQHVDRVRLLVSRLGTGRHCGGWATPVIPALHGAWPCRATAPRTGELDDAGGDLGRRDLCHRSEEVRQMSEKD